MFYANFPFSLCVFVDNWPVNCLTFFFLLNPPVPLSPSFVYKILCICNSNAHSHHCLPDLFIIFLLAIQQFSSFFYVALPNIHEKKRKKFHPNSYILQTTKKTIYIYQTIYFFFTFIYLVSFFFCVHTIFANICDYIHRKCSKTNYLTFVGSYKNLWWKLLHSLTSFYHKVSQFFRVTFTYES